MEIAKDLATEFHHDHVTDQHFFLAILRLGNGIAHEVLTKMDIRPDVATFVEAQLRVGVSGSHLGLDGVVKAAAEQARQLGLNYIGSEHLLLAVLKTEPQRQAARRALEQVVGLATDPTASRAAVRHRGNVLDEMKAELAAAGLPQP